MNECGERWNEHDDFLIPMFCLVPKDATPHFLPRQRGAIDLLQSHTKN